MPPAVLQDIVLDTAGRPRQAGTLGEEPRAYIRQITHAAERSLYYFYKVFVNGNIARPVPHKLFCDFLQEIPSRRKLLMAPRDHMKTSISKALCLHFLVQPDRHNVYFPTGMGSLSHTEGRSTRILFSSKAVDLSVQKLIFIRTWCETYAALLHGFWPEVFWLEPTKQSGIWNNERLLFPRREIFDQPTIATTGVTGTITGQRFNVLLHDDIVDEKDRYSPTTQERAYNWWISTRSLMDGQETSLELTIGTHWSNNDPYVRIERDQLDVEIRKYAALYDARTGQPFSDLKEDGSIEELPPYIVPLWPERYPRSALEKLRRDMTYSGRKDLFILNYFNNPLHAGVVDFNLSEFRLFTIHGNEVLFDPDPRDALLEHAYRPGESLSQDVRGQRFTPALQQRLAAHETTRFRIT